MKSNLRVDAVLLIAAAVVQPTVHNLSQGARKTSSYEEFIGWKALYLLVFPRGLFPCFENSVKN